jgi:type IV secretion system protein VirB9
MHKRLSVMRAAFAVAMTMLATPVAAQLRPHPSGGDPHIQTVDYSDDQIVQLVGTPGYQMMIELSPDEQVRNVALGDGGAWQVSLSKEGNRLFIKPTEADGATNMTVVTSVRVYAFDLLATGGRPLDLPYTVQFRYPARSAIRTDPQYVDVSRATRRLSHYKVSGNRLLRPASITNDGQHTYVDWPRSVAIPAIYASDQSGHETLANGRMGTDDVYVIDGVPDRLTFRIDDDVARAERIMLPKAH